MAQPTDKFTLLDLLHPVDKEFCNSIFKSYSRHLAFIDTLLSTTYKISDDYLLTYQWGKDHFHDLILNSISVSEQWNKAKEVLTITLINEIEDYFSNKHHQIAFTPYLLNKEIAGIKPFDTLIPLIENIIQPCEADLYRSGKTQIERRMKEVIGMPGITAELKEFNIVLHRFYSKTTNPASDITAISGSDKNKSRSLDTLAYNKSANLTSNISALCETDKNIEVLLDALALFFLQSISRSVEFTNHLNQWKEAIDFGRYYHLYPGIRIRFFKKLSVKLSFSKKREAKEFFQEFELGTSNENSPPVTADQDIQ
jgi:hypothetical protein